MDWLLPYMPYLMPLFSAALGGAIAIVAARMASAGAERCQRLKYDHEARLKYSEQQQARGAELYQLCCRLPLEASQMTVILMMHYSKAENATFEPPRSVEPAPMHRVTMLVNVYFPQLKAQLRSLETVMEFFDRSNAAFVQQFARDRRQAAVTLNSMGNVADKIREAAAELTKHLTAYLALDALPDALPDTTTKRVPLRSPAPQRDAPGLKKLAS